MRGGRDYVSNLGRFSDQELTLGSTMELRLTGNHGNLPEMSKRRDFDDFVCLDNDEI
jgi:hypothetical protein